MNSKFVPCLTMLLEVWLVRVATCCFCQSSAHRATDITSSYCYLLSHHQKAGCFQAVCHDVQCPGCECNERPVMCMSGRRYMCAVDGSKIWELSVAKTESQAKNMVSSDHLNHRRKDLLHKRGWRAMAESFRQAVKVLGVLKWVTGPV